MILGIVGPQNVQTHRVDQHMGCHWRSDGIGTDIDPGQVDGHGDVLQCADTQVERIPAENRQQPQNGAVWTVPCREVSTM